MKIWVWLLLTAVVFFAIGFQVKAASVKGTSTKSST